MPQILIWFSSPYKLRAHWLVTCAAFYRSLTRREQSDSVLCLGIGGSHCRSPPQEAFNEIFMCVACVFCVGCERGCMCVHLAYCIIKAPKLAHRKGSEVWEGGGGEGGAAIGRQSKTRGGQNKHVFNISGGMSRFYIGGNCEVVQRIRGTVKTWWRGKEDRRGSFFLQPGCGIQKDFFFFFFKFLR